jgi:hypothetical protein
MSSVRDRLNWDVITVVAIYVEVSSYNNTIWHESYAPVGFNSSICAIHCLILFGWNHDLSTMSFV